MAAKTTFILTVDDALHKTRSKVKVQPDQPMSAVLQMVAKKLRVDWHSTQPCHLVLPESPDVYLAPHLPLSFVGIKAESHLEFREGLHPADPKSRGVAGRPKSATTGTDGRRQACLSQALALISTPSTVDLLLAPPVILGDDSSSSTPIVPLLTITSSEPHPSNSRDHSPRPASAR